MEHEASIPSKLRFYCPSPTCSVPIALEQEPRPDTPVYCPACSTKTCASCGVIWHKGVSCKEYQVETQPGRAARLNVNTSQDGCTRSARCALFLR